MLELWYAALDTPLGLAVRTDNRDKLKMRLYAARAKAHDPSLDALSIVCPAMSRIVSGSFGRNRQMPKRKRQDFDRHTLYLYAGDLERLQELYTPPGAGPFIREMVRAHLRGLDAQAALDEERRR